MIPKAIQKIDDENKKTKSAGEFVVGDMVKVYSKIKEGEKERVQVFAGRVISKKGGGATATFTVRRVSYGVGVERVFPIHSPRIEKIVVEGSGVSRRAKLYFLRDRGGKNAKLREKARPIVKKAQPAKAE